MAWDKLCKMKRERGLGFKRMQEFNRALLMKLGWGESLFILLRLMGKYLRCGVGYAVLIRTCITC